MPKIQHINWLEEIDLESDIYGKHSKFIAGLLQANFPLISGFVISKEAYFDFLLTNNLEYKIRQLLSTISIDLPDSLMQGEYHIKNLFKQASLSDTFKEELVFMGTELGYEVSVELFETGEHGKKHKKISSLQTNELADQLVNLWSEMFSSEALWRRHRVHSDHFENGAEIIVKQKIIGDKTGIITTVDPDTHEKNKIVISQSYPHEFDRYVLSKKNLSIIDRDLKHTTNTNKLSSFEILSLAEVAKKIEEHLYFPQEISWAFDDTELYISDIKPVSTIMKQKTEPTNKLPLARGKGLTSRIGTGRIHIFSTDKLHEISSHDIVIVSHLPANKVKEFKNVRGIIIESNTLPPETIILLKQFGIPTVSNVTNASRKFHNGSIVTIHSAKGEIHKGGYV
jgi:pyruvate,water dikinase